ncbi:MAG TPA: AcrB/AcrD/AcrF family protein [Allosphingosinicella sp.]|jgi:hypothetical protein
MEALGRLEKHWRWWLCLVWLLTAALMVYTRWGQIGGFGLGDTDDNLRIMQVRDLLRGQDWFDLRQYRLNPPFGADIHWSRLVDLPIAGIKLALAPLIGGAAAERWAVALAPMIPLLVAMGALAVTVRRLVSPYAFALALAIFLCGHSARNQFVPLRIDHHGWQLAMLALAVMALTDPKRARGGAILGAATAVSLTIGLEMLLYLAVAGAAVALMWVRDGGQARRLATYGGSLAGGCGLGYLLFASYANRAPVCDALSPVWLSAMVAAGAVCVTLALLSRRGTAMRFGAAVVGGLALAAFFALAWPHCLGRLEGVSDEANRLWLSNVREARPLYRHGWRAATAISALPVFGLLGYLLMLWRERGDMARFVPWLAAFAPALLAALLLLWQSRAGPAAQLLAIPGATALAWLLIGGARSSRLMLVRVLGTVAAFLLISGLLVQQAIDLIPQGKVARSPAVNRANASCPTMAALRPIALQPKGYVLTHVDLGPRLIAVTHHDAIAGPYHRNDDDIVDTMKAFRGTAEEARQTVMKRRIDYVLICPNLSETTIYASQAKNGFYVQLARGQVPAWLEPVPLPAKSPYRMWRVKR